jgi:hypothetical protein
MTPVALGGFAPLSDAVDDDEEDDDDPAEAGGFTRPDRYVIVGPVYFCFLTVIRLRSASINNNSAKVLAFKISVTRASFNISSCVFTRTGAARRSRLGTR